MDQTEPLFNLAIVGGGPASLSFMYSLLKKSKKGLPDILQGNGICIIEKSCNFGSGNLEEKVTYASTPAAEVLKMMVFDANTSHQLSTNDQFWEMPVPKKIDASTSEDTRTFTESEAKQFLQHLPEGSMAVCREVTETHIFQQMVNHGVKCPPKAMMGYYFRLMGNVMLRHIKQVKNQLVFKHSLEVIAVRLLTDGWFQLRLQKHDQGGASTSIPKITTAYQTIKAKSIIFCVGRHQTPLVPQLTGNGQLLRIQAQIILTDEGLIQAYQHIEKHKIQQKKKVSILGTTQIAFEVAELLLNGPTTYRHDEYSNPKINFVQKRLQLEYWQLKTKGKPEFNDRDCFGSLRPQNYKWQSTNVVIPTFNSNEIVVCGETPLVYFQDEQSAKSAGYEPTKDEIGHDGQVNSLTGLRGKSKDLYLRILQKKEIRVAVQNSEVDALIVVDSTNFVARQIPIRDTDGQSIQPLTSCGAYRLDQFGRLQTQKASIRNLFAYGTCAIPNDIWSDCSNIDQIRNSNHSLSFWETARLSYLAKGLKMIEESNKQGELTMSTQPWLDQNQFPRSGQSSQFFSKADFDSDNQSYNSDIVEQETMGLNMLDSMLRQDKAMIRFDKVEKLFTKK